MNLGGEITVERAQGHAGPVGHRPHLHRVIAAPGRQRQGGVQDALAALALGRRAEFGLGGRVRARGGGGTCSRCCHSPPLVVVAETGRAATLAAEPPAPMVTRSSSRPAYQSRPDVRTAAAPGPVASPPGRAPARPSRPRWPVADITCSNSV